MKSLLATLMLLGFTAFSCQRQQDPRPAVMPDFDVLIKSRGHWEWEQSIGFRFVRTPVSEGLTRQLIFKADSQVYIYHDRQLKLQTPYRARHGVTPCQAAGPNPVRVPWLQYTSEPQFPNYEVRDYELLLSPTDTLLFISGIYMCSDLGARERYHWRRN